MAERKQFINDSKVNSELLDLLHKAKGNPVTEADLQEQRLSFAFGNALNRDLVTKDSVRFASQNSRLRS